jgi:hypothetical protein
MKELLEEYGGVIFILILGAGFIAGLNYIFQAVLNGWAV